MSLVFSRRRGEVTVITVPPSTKPTRILLNVVDYPPGNHINGAKLAWDAPREVQIDRLEIANRINSSASALACRTVSPARSA